MNTLDSEEEILARRKFFLSLSPQLGQHFAHGVGGYLVPSPDTQQAESLDTARLYLHMAQTGAMRHIADTSWWMLKIMDPQGQLDRGHANIQCDELASFVIATIQGLMDKGLLKWGVDLPEIDMSRFVTLPKLDVDESIIDRMEKDLDDEH